MLIIVDLHDHEDKSHGFGKFEFEAQATIKQLKEKISSRFQIVSHFQRIFDSNGRRIDLLRGALENAGLRDSETVIVKDCHLRHWSALLDCETEFLQTTHPELKKSIHDHSTGLIEALMDSHFFVTYARFNSRCTEIEKNFLTNFDRKLEAIQNSCKIYFKKLYGENVKLTFNSREEGSRSGCICIIEYQSVISKFFVKTNHGAGEHDAGDHENTRYDIDLKELFVYTLLEHLKMGAEIHFIDNECFSRWIIYIGSREIPGFKTLKFVELAEPQNVKEYSKCAVQMLFVYSVLMLGDYHTANMGVGSAGNPFIVDFSIIGKPLTSVTDLYEGVRMSKDFNMNLPSFNERLKISLDYLNQSNFLTILESSLESFLRHQLIFDNSHPAFDKPQKTHDLLEYVENVSRNIKLFNDYSLNK